MISVSGLGKSFGERTLFAGATFHLNPGERHGLVGANGSGKTTLLNILAGDAEPSEGSVSRLRRTRLGVLRQDRFAYEDGQILEVALMGNKELWEARTRAGRAARPGRRLLRLRALRRAGGDLRAPRRLHGRVPRGGDPRGPRAPGEDPPGSALHAVGRISFAGAAGPGAGERPRRAPARRAHEPPRHPLDPLAREVPAGLLGPRGGDQPRPPLPRQRGHADPGHRLRVGARLPGQLQPLPRGQGRRAGAPPEGDRAPGAGDRAPPEVRGPLPGQGPRRRARRRAGCG